MPEAIIWVVSAIGVEAGSAALIMYATEIAYAAIIIGGLAYSQAKARQAAADMRNQYNAAQVDRMVNVSSSVAPRELVMGRVRKGGAIFFKGSTGAQQRDLYLAIAVAAHEIDAVEGIYLNDELVTLDAEGYAETAPYNLTSTATGFLTTDAAGVGTLPVLYVPGSATATYQGLVHYSRYDAMGTIATSASVSGLTVTTGQPNASVHYQYRVSASKARIISHLGGLGQSVDAALLAGFPADWLAANTVQGVAYLLVKFVYSETSFPSGAANVTAIIRGAKLYDPRTGNTVWSENPALMMRHVYTHPKFGKATPTAAEDARFIAAANACDSMVNYTVASVASTQKLYRASIVLPFGTAGKSALDDLAQAMGGSWAFAGGEIYLKAGVYTASVMSLGDADLAVIQRNGSAETQRPISISVHKARNQKINTVKVKIWDQAQDYKQVSLTPLVGSALLARDGVELAQEVDYPAIGYAPQALHVAGIMMRDARDPLVVDLPFKLRAYPLELFDTVDLTLARYGWSAKTFMVMSRTWNMDGSLQLTLKETSAAITQMDAGFLAQGFAANTNLPKPWEVAAVGALTITSGTAELIKQLDGTIVSRMRVSWPAMQDAAVQQAGRIEVQYRLATSSGAWASLFAQGDDTTIATSEVKDSEIYVIRARARTSLAIGDWGPQVVHAVTGKTAPPSNVAALSYSVSDAGIVFTWIENTEADYDHTELRQGASWAAGTTIANPWVRPASGTYTVWAAHYDTSGNNSTPVSVSVSYTSSVLGIGDLVIGGRNLLANSFDYFPHRSTGSDGGVPTFSGNNSAPDGIPYMSAQTTVYNAGIMNAYFWFDRTAAVDKTKPYTLSFQYRASHPVEFDYYTDHSAIYVRKAAAAVGVWTTFDITVDTPVVGAGTQLFVATWIGQPVGAFVDLRLLKVEEGTIRTAWSAAPEDVAAEAAAKAAAAQAAAIAAAATDATTKANAAQSSAISTAATAAQAKADLAETTAKAYADGIVTAAEAILIADATTKANNAQTAATNAAALDATAKANLAAATSTWAGTTGAGKPADNATAGATLGVDVGGQITPSNVFSLIQAGAITSAQANNRVFTTAYPGNVSNSTLVGSTVVTLTATGAPVAVWATIDIQTLFTNSAIKSIWLLSTLTVDGTPVSSAATDCYVFPIGSASHSSQALQHRFTPTAAAHVFAVNTQVYAFDSGGSAAAFGAGSPQVSQYTSIIAQENKV